MFRIFTVAVASTLLVVSCALFQSTKTPSGCGAPEVAAAIPRLKSTLNAALTRDDNVTWTQAADRAVGAQREAGVCALQEIVADTQREVDGWGQVQRLSCVSPETIATERKARMAEETQLARAQALLNLYRSRQ